MKYTKEYFYIKLYEGKVETDYTGYTQKRALFKVYSNGNITNVAKIAFPYIPAGESVVITHIVISNLEETLSVSRHLRKRITTDTTNDQIPTFEKGEIVTKKKDLIRG